MITHRLFAHEARLRPSGVWATATLPALRFIELEAEIAEIHAGRVVDGDPALVEQGLTLGSD